MTVSASSPGRERQKGQIKVSATVRNFIDEERAAMGELPRDRVRAVTIRRMLVDTGALHLALPADIVAALGLRMTREMRVNTAAGPATMRFFTGVGLEVSGRSSVFSCLELPVGTVPLLGAIPMEELGLQPDLMNQTLILLPEEGPDNFHLMY